MKISSFWFASRKNLLYSICLDVLLFILFFSRYIIFNFNNNIIILNLSFLIFWILTSYIIGKYHHSNISFLNIINQLLISLICFFTLFCSFYFYSYKLIDSSYGSGLSQNFFIFTKYIIFSYIFQVLFNKFILKYLKFTKDWYVIGSEDFFIKCLKLASEKNLNLNLSSIDEIIKNKNINKNIILENLSNFSYLYQDKLLNLNFSGSNILSIIKWCEMVLQRIPLNFLSSDNLLDFFSNVKNKKSLRIRLKRVSDILLSILILLLTFPMLLILGFIVFLEDRGPILYFQKRVGKNGIEFIICKLRTMNVNAEEGGAQWSKKDDKRITNIGRFLRSTRIDELPQLFYVLKGDMSLIGPRPERPEIDLILKEKIPFYDLRYLVKPGLSGWAQVNYPYGSSINDSEIKLTYDFFYIKNFSFWLDLLILFKTIRLVFRREGSLPIR